MHPQVLSRLVEHFQGLGLPAQWYTLPACGAYAALTDGVPTDVHCVEVCLGPSPGEPGYSTFAVAQLPLPRYPNLALTALVSLHEKSRTPSPRAARFSIAIDSKFSMQFLPAAFSAFNALDPSAQGRSLLVSSYSSEMQASDLLHASVYSAKLMRRFRRDGQLAMIAVDYHDPYSRAIAKALKYFRFAIPDMHLVLQTLVPSKLRIPIRAPGDGYHELTGSSTALEQGFAIATGYLDRHYGRRSAAG